MWATKLGFGMEDFLFDLNTTWVFMYLVCLSVDCMQLNSDNNTVHAWLGSMELGWQKCLSLELAICTGVKGCAVDFFMLLKR